MGAKKSKLKLCEDEINFLKRHTSLNRSEIKKWHKKFKRNCPSGRLSKAQFVELHKIFSPYDNTEKYCNHIFRTFDIDKDGTICFFEFLFAINIMGSGTAEEKLMWSFKMFDIDENHYIDLNEMTKIINSIYGVLGSDADIITDQMPEDRAEAIFCRLDKNDDQMITQQEFVGVCLEDEELNNMLTLNIMNTR